MNKQSAKEDKRCIFQMNKRAIVYARESYTEHGLGCAEAVIAALIHAGILDLDGSYVCFGSGFTGGVGCSGGTCGAIYGGEIALGAVYGRKNPRAQPFDRSKKENLEEDYRYYLLRRFNNLIHDFIQKFGSSNCTDLVETENGKLTKQSFDICTNRVQFMVEQTIKYLELNEEENKMLPYPHQSGAYRGVIGRCGKSMYFCSRQRCGDFRNGISG